MINLISDNDMLMMNTWNGMYGGRGSKVPSHLLENWSQGKSKRLQSIFGDKLIYEKRIDVEKSTEEMIREFYIEENSKMRLEFSQFNFDLKEKLRGTRSQFETLTRNEDGSESAYYVFYYNYTVDTIIKGVIEHPFSYKHNGKEYKVNKGSKTVKTLRKLLLQICPEYVERFDKLMQDMSRLTQNKRTTGTLCLSIHPLDFMTMSDNSLNWTSCMSWYECGSYSSGSLSTMYSTDSIIVYLKSDKDMEDGDFVWNNKKWRMLILLNEDGIMPNLQYPCMNDDIKDIAMDWVKELSGYKFEKEGREYDYSSITIYSGLMYNDIGRGVGKYFITEQGATKTNIEFQLGSDSVYCLECGCELEYNQQVVCPCCGDYDYDDY